MTWFIEVLIIIIFPSWMRIALWLVLLLVCVFFEGIYTMFMYQQRSSFPSSFFFFFFFLFLPSYYFEFFSFFFFNFNFQFQKLLHPHSQTFFDFFSSNKTLI
ncbi:hypothetical protein HMI56_003396 [Coelomomyces lativittatus]|nr:hypothetical protein HMI56_003396 [Coelomomyces lativittatus]